LTIPIGGGGGGLPATSPGFWTVVADFEAELEMDADGQARMTDRGIEDLANWDELLADGRRWVGWGVLLPSRARGAKPLVDVNMSGEDAEMKKGKIKDFTMQWMRDVALDNGRCLSRIDV
jgi:hypothetical protein